MSLRRRLCGFALTILLFFEGCSSLDLGCGTALMNTRIVGGEYSHQTGWPWLVSIHIDGKHVCGGSLISDQWVLSAGHCFLGFVPGKVYLGRNSQTETSVHQVSRNVLIVHYHESYNQTTNENDICLLKLSAPVTFTLFIQPVCLPTVASTFHAGLSSWLAGWGGSGINATSDSPDEVNLPIVGNNQCACQNQRPITENMICAGGGAEMKAACQGDSGGALVNKNRDRWVQNGIVSFGDGCAKPFKPGGYTRVSQYQGWIEGIIGVNRIQFVNFTSTGPDTDVNFTCLPSFTTTTQPPTTTTVWPDTTTQPPDTTTVWPDTTTQPPTTTTVWPDTTTQPPDTTTVWPDTTPQPPNTPPVWPDTTPQPPNTPPVWPNTTTQPPKTKTTKKKRCKKRCEDLFCAGENLLHSTHFISLALLVLSLVVVVADV